MANPAEKPKGIEALEISDLRDFNTIDFLSYAENMRLDVDEVDEKDLSKAFMDTFTTINTSNLSKASVEVPEQVKNFAMILSPLVVGLTDLHEYGITKAFKSPQEVFNALKSQKHDGEPYFNEFPNVKIGIKKTQELFEASKNSNNGNTIGGVFNNEFDTIITNSSKSMEESMEPLLSSNAKENLKLGGVAAASIISLPMTAVGIVGKGGYDAYQDGKNKSLGEFALGTGKATVENVTEFVSGQAKRLKSGNKNILSSIHKKIGGRNIKENLSGYGIAAVIAGLTLWKGIPFIKKQFKHIAFGKKKAKGVLNNKWTKWGTIFGLAGFGAFKYANSGPQWHEKESSTYSDNKSSISKAWTNNNQYLDIPFSKTRESLRAVNGYFEGTDSLSSFTDVSAEVKELLGIVKYVKDNYTLTDIELNNIKKIVINKLPKRYKTANGKLNNKGNKIFTKALQ